jgi:uncharacterized protein (DUF2267 family)
MRHDEFVGQLQHRAQLGSRGEAEKVIRCTLETLADRITPPVAAHLADQLPPEIGQHLRVGEPQHLDVREFVEAVAFREGVSYLTARDHSHAVLSLVAQAVSRGIIDKVLHQLPKEFARFFTPYPVATIVRSFHIEDRGEAF